MIAKYLSLWFVSLLLGSPLFVMGQSEKAPIVPELIAESSVDTPISHVISLDTEVDKTGNFRIYLADVFTSSVLVLEQKGKQLEFSTKIGRNGRGPGEFISVNNLQIVDDQNLMVYDRNLGRISVFGPEKEEIVQLFQVSAIHQKGNFPRWFYASDSKKEDYYARSGSFFRASDDLKKQRKLLLQQYSSEGELVKDSILVKPDNEALIVRGQTGMAVNPQPVFGKKSIIRINNDLIYYGWTGSNSIEVYTADGDCLQTIALDLPHLEVTQTDINLALERESLMMEEDKNVIEDVFFKQVPSFWPYFNDFLLDDENRFWIAGAAPMEQKLRTWHIYSMEGKLIKNISLPANFTAFQIKDNYVIGELLDEEFRSSVRIYRIN